MSSWSDASEENMGADGFCENCEQIAEILWMLDGDCKCTECRDKEIAKGN